MKKILFVFVAAFAMLFTACNSCSKPEPTPEPVFSGYNFDEVIASDYDYIASQFDHFFFRTAEARFDSVLAKSDCNTLNYVGTTFQCGHHVHQFFHTTDTIRLKKLVEYAEMISTWKEWSIDTTEVDYVMYLEFEDAVLECGELNARNPITFDSCMKIIEPVRNELYTKALTLRRFLDPREPENAQYIFGTGNVIVDVITGEISSVRNAENLLEITE
jgi:hypothetical protein